MDHQSTALPVVRDKTICKIYTKRTVMESFLVRIPPKITYYMESARNP